MKLSLGWVRTRVARRILGLFVVGAALPVAVMAVLSFVAVNRQIGAQAEERLGQLAKNAGQSVLQQLLLTESGLRRIADAVARGPDALPGPPPAVMGIVWDQAGEARPLMGEAFSVPVVDSAQAAFLAAGGTVLVAPTSSSAGMFAALSVEDAGAGPGVVWARLEADSLWSAARTFTSLPTVEEFCVLGGDAPLYCLSGTRALGVASALARDGSSAGVSEVRLDGRSYMVGYWDLFLQPAFGASTWTLVVAESVESVNAPLDAFSFSFPLSMLVGLLIVVWLAYVQVTRTMGPLQALGEGTRDIASGNFGARVRIASEDEFGALAGSFNQMAEDLGTQFTQLEAVGAIDRAVLGAQEQDQVVGSVLDQFGAVVPCRSVAVLLQERGGGDAARLRWRTGTRTLGGTSLNLLSEDLAWLRSHQGSGIARDGQEPPFVRRARAGLGPGPVVVLPFLVKGQVRGAILFERPEGQDIRAADLDRGRQVADQAAVALDEIRLIEELEEMSWGAIRALARAIDAKSRWTAGHSERVTESSLGLARQMGLDEDQLDILHRGGLLHDVGKIGVPARVLDMEGPLSPEDWELIRAHPTAGAQILAPIPALRPALPIVQQHHERWDGQGYPAGLRGEEIDRLARILSVADTYDAMTSARPYHAPQEPSVALHEIVLHSGSQFDPEPVDAFVAYLARQDIRPEAQKRKIR